MANIVPDIARAPGACADVYIVQYGPDNYGYIVVDRESGKSFVIDGADAPRFISALDGLRTEPAAIFTTHHHADHSAGNEGLHRAFPKIPIYGSAYESIPGATEQLQDKQQLRFGQLTVTALHVPTHTKGHLAYLVENTFEPGSTPVVFTGDFLFLAGCGRFFEGDANTMKQSINKLFDALSPRTYMFPGHEYSASNLKFALSVDKDNAAVSTKLDEVTTLRNQGKPSIPSSIAEELSYNPFVRAVRIPQECSNFSKHSGDVVAMLGEFRQMKDNF